MLRLVFAALASLLLTGCWLAPGNFTSELALMKDGSFSYSYNGEIQMLGLSKLAQMGSKSDDEFSPESCLDDEYEIRECTSEEIAEQRAEWDEEAAERRAKREKEAEQAKLLMGGIDPTSPEAADEFVELLSRQKGWTKVVHRGDGIFDVEFETTGTLTHDFMFPFIEGMPYGNAFVTIALRKDDTMRVNAPGFAAQGSGNPLSGMMGGSLGSAMLASKLTEDGETPAFVELDGIFTIVTDGEILANNTNEGPTTRGSARVLSWEISPRTEQAPMALIALR